MSTQKPTGTAPAAIHIGPNFSEAERIAELWDAILRAVNIDREPWYVRWLLKRASIKAAHGLFAVNHASIANCNFSGLRTDTGIKVGSRLKR